MLKENYDSDVSDGVIVVVVTITVRIENVNNNIVAKEVNCQRKQVNLLGIALHMVVGTQEDFHLEMEKHVVMYYINVVWV